MDMYPSQLYLGTECRFIIPSCKHYQEPKELLEYILQWNKLELFELLEYILELLLNWNYYIIFYKGIKRL